MCTREQSINNSRTSQGVRGGICKTDKIQPPGTLNFAGNVAENWRKWKNVLSCTRLTANGIDTKE